MNDTLLLVNIGNTTTSVALAAGSLIERVRRLPTNPPATDGVIRAAIRHITGVRHIAGAVLCSVVPARSRPWQRIINSEAHVMPLLVSHRLKLGVRLNYPRPATLGADRLANICAAADRRPPPLIIIDVGTATTFDVVNRKGEFVGGAIAPGPAVMADYMADRTALLPRIKWPARVPLIGRTTRAAMAVGAGAGYRGMLKTICIRLASAIGEKTPGMILTGGYSTRFAGGLGLRVQVRPLLTLEGLIRIYALNRIHAR